MQAAGRPLFKGSSRWRRGRDGRFDYAQDPGLYARMFQYACFVGEEIRMWYLAMVL
jgi:hypothetical protein